MGASFQTSASSSSSWSESLSDYFSNSVSNQNSTSQSVSQSGTRESDISKTQASILQNAADVRSNTFYPELTKAINEQTPGTAEFNALQEQQANAVNASFDAAQKATNQTIAQMGVGGATGSGTQAALTAANERARSSALAQNYFNAVSQQTANKQNLLSLMNSSLGTPTSDTGYLTSSTSTSTSQSTANSEAESGGESKGQSGSESNSFSVGSRVSLLG